MKLFEIEKTRWFHIIIIMATLLAVYISIKFLGRDNPVEEAVEEIADTMVEIKLRLPKDSVDIDLTPEKTYVDNT